MLDNEIKAQNARVVEKEDNLIQLFTIWCVTRANCCSAVHDEIKAQNARAMEI